MAHTEILCANRIGFYLLPAIGTAWALILPRSRALGMRLLPWLALIAGTGSTGLLAMTARMLDPEAASGRPKPF